VNKYLIGFKNKSWSKEMIILVVNRNGLDWCLVLVMIGVLRTERRGEINRDRNAMMGEA
jgi:hypothetical protein